MEKFNFKLYCRNCKKIVNVYKCKREENAFPELKPEFDLITLCCSICKKPIIKISRVHKEEEK